MCSQERNYRGGRAYRSVYTSRLMFHRRRKKTNNEYQWSRLENETSHGISLLIITIDVDEDDDENWWGMLDWNWNHLNNFAKDNETRRRRRGHCSLGVAVDADTDNDADGYRNYLGDDSIGRNSTRNSMAMTKKKTIISVQIPREMQSSDTISESESLRTERLEFDDELEQWCCCCCCCWWWW